MLINSRAVSLLLACSIAVVTVAFLSLVEGTSLSALFVAGTLSFSSAFILTYITLEFLIFKEINKIYAGLDKITRKELQYYSKDHQTSSNPVRRINEEIQAYVTLKEQEIDKLKKLEAYRKEFIADVSHELKTPIFAAQGYVLTLLDGAIDDDKVKYKFLKKAAKSLSGLDALVQDLLILSQIESGVIRMQFSVFDIQELILDVFDQLESKAMKKNISFELAGQKEKGIFVKGDLNRMMQVMSNLINNAIKYGRIDGFVRVALADQNGHIQISVTDNGPGIPPEHIGRVFERFYRVDKSRSKKQGGTGLGLAIVKHILEGHRSRITVESDVNIGTTFSFKLEKGNPKEAISTRSASHHHTHRGEA